MFFYSEYYTAGFSKTLVWYNISEHSSVHSQRHDVKPHWF